MSSETRVVSFVLRFVCDAPADGASRPAVWRGVIRQVQSDAECHFTHWNEAMAFIGQYVNLDDNAAGPQAVNTAG
jgi:hypothetical protein